jgi:hypothetical protein
MKSCVAWPNANNPMPTEPEQPAQQYLLWCATCGRTDERTRGEVAQFARDGWPRCCDAALSYLARPPAPPASDTAPDKPALPPNAGGATP